MYLYKTNSPLCYFHDMEDLSLLYILFKIKKLQSLVATWSDKWILTWIKHGHLFPLTDLLTSLPAGKTVLNQTYSTKWIMKCLSKHCSQKTMLQYFYITSDLCRQENLFNNFKYQWLPVSVGKKLRFLFICLFGDRVSLWTSLKLTVQPRLASNWILLPQPPEC